MSVESERVLERINLMVATDCIVVTPLLVVTSGMLLFSNQSEPHGGFEAALFTIVAGSLSSIVFD